MLGFSRCSVLPHERSHASDIRFFPWHKTLTRCDRQTDHQFFCAWSFLLSASGKNIAGVSPDTLVSAGFFCLMLSPLFLLYSPFGSNIGELEFFSPKFPASGKPWKMSLIVKSLENWSLRSWTLIAVQINEHAYHRVWSVAYWNRMEFWNKGTEYWC